MNESPSPVEGFSCYQPILCLFLPPSDISSVPPSPDHSTSLILFHTCFFSVRSWGLSPDPWSWGPAYARASGTPTPVTMEAPRPETLHLLGAFGAQTTLPAILSEGWRLLRPQPQGRTEASVSSPLPPTLFLMRETTPLPPTSLSLLPGELEAHILAS